MSDAEDRQDRIDMRVFDVVVDGLGSVCEHLHDLVLGGEATPEEIADALRSAPDPSDEWAHYLREMEEDES